MTSIPELDHRGLRLALATLAGIGIVPGVTGLLDSQQHPAIGALLAAIKAEIPAFSASGNPEVLPGLQQHVEDQVAAIVRLFGGEPIGDLGFVRAHAARRAEQHFPLEMMLHAYRCGHRVLAQWLRDTLLPAAREPRDQVVSALADFAIEYTNAVSSVAAAAYVARTRQLAAAETDQRIALLTTLLAGFDESDGRVAQLLKRAGYLDHRQAYCVVAVQSAQAAEMDHPDRVARIVEAVNGAFAGTSMRLLCGVRNNLVTAILSDRRRQSGWTAAHESIVARARLVLELLGPAVIVGLSADHPSTAFIPKALQEATMALEFASVTHRVAAFGEIPVRDLLVRHGMEMVRATPPAWLQPLLEADHQSDGILLETLKAIAGSDMNIQSAARALGKHPNTLYARLERIHAACGRDGLRFHDLSEMLLAADCYGVPARLE